MGIYFWPLSIDASIRQNGGRSPEGFSIVDENYRFSYLTKRCYIEPRLTFNSEEVYYFLLLPTQLRGLMKYFLS